MSKVFRDNRLYMNSDKQPKKGDIIKNMGGLHTVKGVSKCGHRLYIKGWPMTEYCNTGCSRLDGEGDPLPPSKPDWLIDKFGI